MKRQLDKSNWQRKSHFDFFKEFDEPFFGITAEVDCTDAYKAAKEAKSSFFLYYLHKSLIAVNEIEEFRYRITGDEVFVYDEVGASATITRPDGTFGFSYIKYARDFNVFEEGARAEIKRVKADNQLIPATSSENVIHYSSIPWVKFTSVSHARKFNGVDSIPKISFGKMSKNREGANMPVSVHVHHALMDGFHVGKYFTYFEELMHNS